MKNGKSLLIPFIIMVVLFIGVMIFFAVSRSNDSAQPSDQSVVNALYVNSSDVKTVTVTSSNPDFPQVCINVTKKDDSSLDYTYCGSDFDPEVIYSDSKMSAYVLMLTDYSTATVVSENANMSDFGLDIPRYTIVIETVSGTISKVAFGNTSFSGESCYIRIDDGNTVYSVPVDKLDYISDRSIDLIDTTVLSIDPASLTEVEFMRKTDDIDLKATCTADASGYVIYTFYDPFVLNSGTYFDSLIENICYLDITEFVEIDSADLASYMLDDPEYHFILKCSDGSTTEVLLSENIAGYYYGYVAGTGKYFSISDSQIQGLEIPSVQYLDSYVSYYQASDISTLKGSYDGLTFEFKINTDSEGSISGDDSTVTLDGRNAKVFNSDGRSYCAVLFESFACMEIGGIDTSAVVNTSATPELILEYTTTQYEIHTIEFYKRSDNSYYVVKDGEYTKLFVYSKELFNDGGTDTYNYGVWAAYELLKTAIDENVNGVYDIPVTTEEAA